MPDRNFENRTLYHRDNLDILRGMNSGTVNLIATDPPFNKNRDFHATPNSLAGGARFEDRWRWEEDVHEEWVDSIKDNWPGVWAVIESARVAYGPDMAAFLCWLGVRLMEMHRILREDGSIYLHCDATAGAYIKQLMDSMFGVSNFKNEVTWERTRGRSDGRHWGNTTDTILFYTKSNNYVWHNVYRERVTEAETTLGDLTAAETRNGISGEPWQGYNPTDFGRHWAVPRNNRLAEWIEENRIPGYLQIVNPHARLDALNNAGMIAWSENGRPAIIRPAEASAGAKVNNLWDDITRVSGQESTGYPTQKPLALYERIIRASSNPGDLVLDPFCGCATTPIAAERLGRQWVGIDIWDEAYNQVLTRLKKEGLAVPESADIQPGQQVLTLNHIHYKTDPPARTDDDEIPVPNLRLRIHRGKEPWERLTNSQVRAILEKAQAVDDLVGCAGCGRVLEAEFMELDHITPKTENGADHLINRILLCRPCNGRKSNQLTMAGLRRQNQQVGWLKDRSRAEQIQQRALLRATQIRDSWGTPGYSVEELVG